MAILAKNHGAHLCIISRNKLNTIDSLDLTIKSIYNTFNKIRSLIYVDNLVNKNKNKNNNSLINEIVYLDTTKNKGALLNNLFQLLREKQIYRIVIFWEGEIILGKTSELGWSSSIGSFLKISTNTSYIWQLREFNLINKWYFKDPYGEIPNLDVTNKVGMAISRLTGDYLIVDLNGKLEDFPLFFGNPYYIYKKACYLLLQGEIDMAEDLFNKRVCCHLGHEIISRSYLGIAICNKMKLNTWDILEKYLLLSLKYNIQEALDPIYFLLSWSLELEKEASAYKIICQNKHLDLFKTEPPASGLLPNDSTIYEYAVLYLFTKCCFKLHKYQTVKKTSDILLIRNDIPITIKQDLLHMTLYAEDSIKRFNEASNEFKKEKDILNANISLTIEKTNKVGIIPSELGNYNYLTNIIDNDNDNDNDNNNDNNNLPITNISNVTYQSYNLKNNFMLINQPEQFWLSASLWKLTERSSYQIFPKTPLFCWTGKEKLNTILHTQKYQYEIAIINMTSETNLLLEEIIKLIKIPYKKIVTITLNLSKFNNILYISNKDHSIVTDVMNLLLFQLLGCNTIYYGNNIAYQIVKQLFPDTITNISGWNSKYICDLVNHLTDIPNTRQQFTLASNLLFTKLIEKYLSHVKKTRNLLEAIITLENGEINPHLILPKNYHKISASNRKEAYDQLIALGFQHWSLIISEGILQPYQLVLANLLIKNLSKTQFNIPDLIIIPECNNSTLLTNLKISLESDIWEFTRVTSLAKKDLLKTPILVKSSDSFKIINSLEDSNNISDLYIVSVDIIS